MQQDKIGISGDFIFSSGIWIDSVFNCWKVYLSSVVKLFTGFLAADLQFSIPEYIFLVSFLVELATGC